MSQKKIFTGKRMVSAVGRASRVWVAKPDTKFDEKFKVSLKFDKESDAADAFLKALRAEAKAAGSNDPVEDGDKGDYEPNHGSWIVEFKSKRRPKVVDSKKNELPATAVQAGDMIKVSFEAVPYEAFGGGVSKRMGAIMIVDKRSDPTDAFEAEEDGYVADLGEFGDGETVDAGNGDF